MRIKDEQEKFGMIKIEEGMLWGTQTQLSLENFAIGYEKMPQELIAAFALIKKSAAIVNHRLEKLPKKKKDLIATVCDKIIDKELEQHFPLPIWQTGSGTHTNMNLNEVICNQAKHIDPNTSLHPNDDVNMGQSSNDTFPTAMKIAVCQKIEKELLAVLEQFVINIKQKEQEFRGIIKVGRTHLQDATPLYLSDELSGYRSMIEHSILQIKNSLITLKELPIGATAVGTGINTHKQFGKYVVEELNSFLSSDFIETDNKFYGLTSHDSEVVLSGALSGLASNLLKIINDLRWSASGPRCGIGELVLPANEAGSSIMPGKVNPTQIEALSMVCVQVSGNHTTIAMAASQGNFELNVYKPVIIYNLIQSITLLSDGIKSFDAKCFQGIGVNKEIIEENLHKNLMLVTSLNPYIGYDNGTKIAKYALKNNISLKESAIKLGILSGEEFDAIVNIKNMV